MTNLQAASAHRNRAFAALDLGRWDLVEQEALESIRLAPEASLGYYLLAVALRRTDRDAEAQAPAEKALALEPQEPIYLNQVGGLYLDREHWFRAEPYFREAVRLAPSTATYLSNLARCLAAKWKDLRAEFKPPVREEALQLAERAWSLAPADPDCLSWLKNVFRDLNEVGRAEETIRCAIALAPNDMNLRLDLADVLLRQNRNEEALELVREIRPQVPSDSYLWSVEACAYWNLKQLEKAELAANEALRLNPKESMARNVRRLIARQREEASRPPPPPPPPLHEPGPWDGCPHENVVVINDYETVRKYRCRACQGVMICACDQEYCGEDCSASIRVADGHGGEPGGCVNAGFVKNVCRECRGLPPRATPLMYGTLIERYYWREIAMATWIRLRARLRAIEETGKRLTDEENRALRKEIDKEVLAEMKALHQRTPKYDLPRGSRDRRSR